MDTETQAIVEKALREAGVPPENINLTPDEVTPPTAFPPRPGVVYQPPKAEEGVGGKKEATPAEVEEPTEKPLTKAEIVQILDEHSRRFQSITDRRVAQLQGQLGTALQQLQQAQEARALENMSPEDQLKVRLDRLERQFGQPAPQQQLISYEDVVGYVQSFGLKQGDPRLDWAAEEDNPNAGLKRLQTSIAKAVKEDNEKAVKASKDEAQKAIAKLRKDLGVDKVPTSGASGAGIPNLDKLSPMEKIDLGFRLKKEEQG